MKEESANPSPIRGQTPSHKRDLPVGQNKVLTMPTQELKEQLLRIVAECLAKGPGYAQELVVLREASEQLGLGGDREKEQELLTCWHDLFRDGELSWGYDIDNPNTPFFHKPNRNLVERAARTVGATN